MFQYLLRCGARLDIKNHQEYSPLTLAAKLARTEVFILFLLINFNLQKEKQFKFFQ